MSAPTILADLRPQAFKSGMPAHIADAIVEPLWVGVRVLAAVERRGGGGTATTVITDEAGEPVRDQQAIEAALLAAARADTLIVDGYLTKQVAHDGTGTFTSVEERVSTGTLIAQQMIGVRRNRAAELVKERERLTEARSFEPSDVVALVATDLLQIDDERLFDVPLLERKRLLEAVLGESDVIRLGQYVRPPIETWIGSWRSLGFSGISFKSPNGRYRPGTTADDWTIAPMPRR